MSFNIAAKVNNLSGATRNILNELADTQTEVDSIFSNYVANTPPSSSLEYYITASILEDYETVDSANTSHALKANITAVDTSLELKVNVIDVNVVVVRRYL